MSEDETEGSSWKKHRNYQANLEWMRAQLMDHRHELAMLAGGEYRDAEPHPFMAAISVNRVDDLLHQAMARLGEAEGLVEAAHSVLQKATVGDA